MRPVVPLVVLGLSVSLLAPAYAQTRFARPLPSPVVVAPRPPMAAGPRIELVGDGMQTLPTFAHEGRRFVLGTTGQRYRIRLVNPTAARVEAVISVDGLDAIDGRPAGLGKRGYLIPAFGDVTIDGWRTSLDTVAAFRFSSVPSSYAGQQGDDRNVGVIGVAFFRERPPVVWRQPPVAWGPRASGAAGAPAPKSQSADASRSGLGTQFGEQHESHVDESPFERADANPSTVAQLRYDDRQGLVARGILPARDARQAEIEARDRAQPFPGSMFAQAPR